jgi:hypothetical protein
LIPQDLPGLIHARSNPAGRKPLRERTRACGIPTGELHFWLQTQRPNNRTADDPAGNAASDNDGSHDASSKEKRRQHGPLRERDSPHRVKKMMEPDRVPVRLRQNLEVGGVG